MKMCPWNKEGLLAHRLVMWAAIKWKWTHRLLIWLDDKMGYGVRKPIKRWWWDLETKKKDGPVVRAEKTSERDLSLERLKMTDHRPVAVYPPERFPEPDRKEPLPFDRKQGLVDAEKAADDLRAAKAAGMR